MNTHSIPMNIAQSLPQEPAMSELRQVPVMYPVPAISVKEPLKLTPCLSLSYQRNRR